jgi:hypothetical protein
MFKTWRVSAKIAIVTSVFAFYLVNILSCQNQNTQTGNVASNQPTAPATAQPRPTMPPLPQGFPMPQISGNIPVTVTLPDSVKTPEEARPFFDYFSWESFIALSWPALPGSRGVADQPNNSETFYSAANGSALVWGTYKESFELFGQRDQRPTAWSSYDVPISPCKDTNVSPGQKVFILLSKGDTTLDSINQAFSYPLIDQQKNYVSYEIRYNEAQYNFVRGTDNDNTSWLYLVKNLAPKEPVQMPASMPPNNVGAMMLKAAWRVKTEKDDVSRYYKVDAQVLDPASGKCNPQTMLLVGFHIAQKLQSSPEWIWSTFEQVDNVPADTSPATPPGGYSFNNGTSTPFTVNGFANRPPNPAPSVQPPDQRVPVQVTRLNPIPDTPKGASTRDINAIYQSLLKGTVWQFYQLVTTQWPSTPQVFTTMESGGVYPKDSGGAFPANGVTNTTMETYFQSQATAAGAGGNSCMSCHYRAGKADFSWGLLRRSH